MGDVVNLKRFRRRLGREQSAREADANRARELLDRHRIEGEDAS